MGRTALTELSMCFFIWNIYHWKEVFNMRKIISLILLCPLLLVCFSGCTSLNNKENETISGNKNEGDILNLNEIFDTIRNDSQINTKLGFSIEYEQTYYELKESGQYDNADWTDSVFIVTVSCDYEAANDEDWYKQCSEKDVKSLNAAFYNYYGADLSKGNYSNIVSSPGMHLMYYSPEDFNNDYAAIKALTDLDCVTEVYVVYKFPVPNDYFLE